MKRSLFQRVCVAALALSAGSAMAQAFPTKPIRFLVGFVPGGSVDILARDLAGPLTQSLGQQVIIANRGGAAGLLAAEATAKASPDGHTILMAIPNHVIAPSVYAKIPYDTIGDFAPVSLVASSPFMLLANNGVPANNLKDFIALVKAKPGQLNYATPGQGSIQHLSNELLNGMAGIKMVHVPYKGGVPALIDTIAGAAAVTFITTVQGLPQLKAGKVKTFGVSSSKRAAVLPDVPTLAEAGVPGSEQAVPRRDREAFEARFGDRRNVGYELRARAARVGERAQLARFDVRHGDADVAEHDRDLASERVSDRGVLAFVRHVRHADSQQRVEELARHVRRRADSARAVGERMTRLFRERHEVAERLRGERRVDDHQERRRARERDRREILQRVVRRAAV